jgi:hypothetical protein
MNVEIDGPGKLHPRSQRQWVELNLNLNWLKSRIHKEMFADLHSPLFVGTKHHSWLHRLECWLPQWSWESWNLQHENSAKPNEATEYTEKCLQTCTSWSTSSRAEGRSWIHWSSANPAPLPSSGLGALKPPAQEPWREGLHPRNKGAQWAIFSGELCSGEQKWRHTTLWPRTKALSGLMAKFSYVCVCEPPPSQEPKQLPWQW